ncbi:MAG: NADH-quinone oxidoreductase subunit J [Planctomycetota bacterium]|nr:NADH-quinone oxidoreductase subunit J [Planctomycetota bacterium]MDG2083628.1 NADH-quinone oxidoreductase subunit J [Planctomycetota bacterium]
MSGWLEHLIFGILATASVASSFLVVTRRNPIYSALFLIVMFGMVAGIFMLLDATFLGFMQLLVYAGAIMVLYLFVIMLINPRDDSLPEESGFTEKTFAVGVALLVFSLLAFGISNSETVSTLAEAGTIPDLPEVAQTHGAIEAFGYELFHKHLLVFEVASILILVGIIGAVHIAMKNKPAPVELGANDEERLVNDV